MKEIPYFLIGLFCGVGLLGFLLAFTNNGPRQIEQKMQKEAIFHGAAHYEVNTNGVVCFKWNK